MAADTDGTATIGIASRLMLGQVKHATLFFLWIPERTEQLTI